MKLMRRLNNEDSKRVHANKDSEPIYLEENLNL
jgi:hypothetical protein